MDLQVIKGQKTIKYQICYNVTVFVLILFKSNQQHWLEFLKRVLAPWVYRMRCSTFTIVCQFHVQNLWGCSSWSEVAACLQRHEVPPNIHFQDTSFFFFGGAVEASIYPLYLVWCIQELNPHINLTPSRLEMPLEIRELKSDQVWGKGGDEQFTHSIHQRWYLQFKKRNTNIFYNGKKPEI